MFEIQAFQDFDLHLQKKVSKFSTLRTHEIFKIFQEENFFSFFFRADPRFLNRKPVCLILRFLFY